MPFTIDWLILRQFFGLFNVKINYNNCAPKLTTNGQPDELSTHSLTPYLWLSISNGMGNHNIDQQMPM